VAGAYTGVAQTEERRGRGGSDWGEVWLVHIQGWLRLRRGVVESVQTLTVCKKPAGIRNGAVTIFSY
jgi:hypothetical protein